MTRASKLSPTDLEAHLGELNEVFGELRDDGAAKGPEDYVTDPEALARFPRPTDAQIKGLVRRGVEALRKRESQRR